MHSIAIHLYENKDEWHLIEPMFYKVQSNKHLSFFYERNDGSKLQFNKIFSQVSEYLQFRNIDCFQVIFIMHIPEYEKSFARLASYFKAFKQDFIALLKERGHHPENESVLIIDSLNKVNDKIPTENIVTNIWWQLDNYGYIKTPIKDQLFHNSHLLTIEDVTHIDSSWGQLTNLHDAGLINNPNQEFLKQLQNKYQIVVEQIETLFSRKKEHLKHKNEAFQYDGITDAVLEEVKQRFCKQLYAAIQPPLSESLVSFKPSDLLKEILQNEISLKKYKQNFTVLRVEISNTSQRHRIQDLIKLSLFINLLATKSELVNRLNRGTFNQILMKMSDKKLEQTIINYQTGLEVAEQAIKDQLIDRKLLSVKKYNNEESFPYTVTQLAQEKIQEPLPLFNHKNSTFQFESNLDKYLFMIEETIKNREKSIFKKVKDGVTRLSIEKRKNMVSETVEETDINEYLTSLQKEIKETVCQIDELSAGNENALSKWKRRAYYTKRKLRHHTQFIPSPRHYWMTFLFVTAILVIPFMSSHFSRSIFSNNLYSAMFIPFGVTMSYFITRLSMKAIKKPIISELEKTKLAKENCFTKQDASISNYNKYLNKMYKLYSLRKQYDQLNSEYTNMKRENVSYLYHQNKIEEHKMINSRLMCLVQNSKRGDRRSCEAFFEQVFNLNKSVIDNMVYSPLDYQFKQYSEDHKIKVNIGNAYDSLSTEYLTPLNELLFSVDRVYLQ
jgi:hypothetical protein